MLGFGNKKEYQDDWSFGFQRNVLLAITVYLSMFVLIVLFFSKGLSGVFFDFHRHAVRDGDLGFI